MVSPSFLHLLCSFLCGRQQLQSLRLQSAHLRKGAQNNLKVLPHNTHTLGGMLRLKMWYLAVEHGAQTKVHLPRRCKAERVRIYIIQILCVKQRTITI